MRQHGGYARLRLLVLLFLIGCVVSGCGAAKLGYANGESISAWWLNGYVDFDPDQKQIVKNNLSELFAWHRKTQLRDYGQFLGSMQKRLQHPVSVAETKVDGERIKKYLLVMTERAAPSLAELALTLRPNQLVQIEKKFAANDEKFRKEYLRGDADDRKKFRFKKMLDQAEYWFGNFSAEQEAQIRIASDARLLNNEIWLADKVKRQRELITILKKIQADRPSRDTVAATLRDYMMAGIERPADHEQKAFFDAASESTAAITTTIINMATPAQKEKAIKKAQQWIDDFNELAAKGV